jgi:hypothetical protein
LHFLAESVALAGERHEQLQQIDKNVVQADVDTRRRHDVVGFATSDDAAMKLKSFFVVVAIALIASRMPPVPTAAMPIS